MALAATPGDERSARQGYDGILGGAQAREEYSRGSPCSHLPDEMACEIRRDSWREGNTSRTFHQKTHIPRM